MQALKKEGKEEWSRQKMADTNDSCERQCGSTDPTVQRDGHDKFVCCSDTADIK
eukprot:m.372081 g.372081  ORF g.372081 m.372081 type:complete len:54 (+) comp62086_c0_seq1:130-291(+)